MDTTPGYVSPSSPNIQTRVIGCYGLSDGHPGIDSLDRVIRAPGAARCSNEAGRQTMHWGGGPGVINLRALYRLSLGYGIIDFRHSN